MNNFKLKLESIRSNGIQFRYTGRIPIISYDFNVNSYVIRNLEKKTAKRLLQYTITHNTGQQ